MYRNLIPALADRYRVLAPDDPGFGRNSMPPRDEFAYTFENLAGSSRKSARCLGDGTAFVFPTRPKRILVTNRSPETASAVVARYGGEAVLWERLDEALARADIILSTTGAPEPRVMRDRYARRSTA